MTTAQNTSRTEEFYVFAGRNGWAWCEMFTAQGHAILPTAFRSVSDAVEACSRINPSAYVDSLDDDCVPAEVRKVEAEGGSFSLNW